MRIAFRTLLLAASLLCPPAAVAGPMACADHDAMKAGLAKNVHETAVALGLETMGRPVVLFTSPDGSWTLAMIVAGPDGRRLACIVAMGTGWQPIPAVPPGRAS